MAKQCYIPRSFKPETLALITRIEEIVDEYQAQGYVLTVRQLYYQLVARDIIPNTLESYKRAAGIINDAKHAGLIDWDMLEDRTREFVKRPRWSSASEILYICSKQFHMDLWEGQEYRPFVIIEKEALVGVFEPVCRELDVPLLPARGYPSGSVLREFAVQDMRDALDDGQVPVILHFGDHDPSGIDMTRDLQERLTMYLEQHVEVRRLALNMEQVEEQQPPENPAKTTDARFEGYAHLFGHSSWELDALSPTYLGDLVSTHIEEYTDSGLLENRKQVIEETRERLKEVAAGFNE
jgi:hypothetical protein